MRVAKLVDRAGTQVDLVDRRFLSFVRIAVAKRRQRQVGPVVELKRDVALVGACHVFHRAMDEQAKDIAARRIFEQQFHFRIGGGGVERDKALYRDARRGVELHIPFAAGRIGQPLRIRRVRRACPRCAEQRQQHRRANAAYAITRQHRRPFRSGGAISANFRDPRKMRRRSRAFFARDEIMRPSIAPCVVTCSGVLLFETHNKEYPYHDRDQP